MDEETRQRFERIGLATPDSDENTPIGNPHDWMPDEINAEALINYFNSRPSAFRYVKLRPDIDDEVNEE